ncbi:hypothetical protein MPL3365_130533 [Mesorhizobium plurifarium]|uniref:Uncharacterized protein n=1 Tax=Mesorhizobium plurifarium TaxID=69974 RepID=A0A090G3G1_MESPL|nr:hypothetical protein MPL3365_130533 [Mesorhizobium plurifarium]
MTRKVVDKAILDFLLRNRDKIHNALPSKADYYGIKIY